MVLDLFFHLASMFWPRNFAWSLAGRGGFVHIVRSDDWWLSECVLKELATVFVFAYLCTAALDGLLNCLSSVHNTLQFGHKR